MENKNVLKVPMSLVANSEEEMTELFMKNNVLNDQMFVPYSTYQRPDGKIVSWFLVNIDNYIRIEDER